MNIAPALRRDAQQKGRSTNVGWTETGKPKDGY
jgi:hypothetical protein